MTDRPPVPVMMAPFELEGLLDDEPLATDLLEEAAPPPPPQRRARRIRRRRTWRWKRRDSLIDVAFLVAESPPEPEPEPEPELVLAIEIVPEPAPEPERAPVPEPETPRRERRTRTRRRRSLLRTPVIVLLAVVLLVAVAAIFAAIRLGAALPPASVTSILSSDVQVTAPVNALPWAPLGQSAVAVPSIGIDVASGPEQPVAVASLTKMMTAYVVLHDHPLGPTDTGPSLTMTQADVDDFNNDTVQDQSNAQVTVGEVLTERQLLGGMLVHSADNYSSVLAVWDAGSIAAFVQKMNDTAARLGMSHTHYNDASGFDPQSKSTAADQLRVAAPDMNNPAFASIVNATSITLPVAGTITSYTPLIGFDGVIGVKSGFTNVAGGCDVLAVVRRAHGLPVLILAAITSQQGPSVLTFAGEQALALANAVGPLISATPVVRSGMVVAHVKSNGQTIDATVRGTANMLTWPGVTAKRVFKSNGTIPQGAKAGRLIGSEIVTVGTQRVVLPVRLTHAVPKESMSQRLF